MTAILKTPGPDHPDVHADPILVANAWLAVMQDAAAAHRNALRTILVTFGGAKVDQITDVDEMTEAWSQATATMAAWTGPMESGGWLESINSAHLRQKGFARLLDEISAMGADLDDFASLPPSVGRVLAIARELAA